MARTGQITYITGASRRTGYAAKSLRNMRSNGTGPLSFIQNGRIAYEVAELDRWMAERKRDTTRGGIASAAT